MPPPDLEVVGDRGAELDELVVEERDADLERVRHRGAVEVVEHVVDERELAVEVERRRQRVVATPPSRVAANGSRARSPSSRERARQSRARSVVELHAGRSSRAALDRVASASVPRAARVEPGRARSDAGADCAAPGEARPTSATSAAARCLRVAAEELVRALARERNGHMPGRELRESVEAEGREVGERLVEVPDELGEVDDVGRERELELVVVGAEVRRRRSARRRARCLRRPR